MRENKPVGEVTLIKTEVKITKLSVYVVAYFKDSMGNEFKSSMADMIYNMSPVDEEHK